MKKKIIATLISMVMAFSLTACQDVSPQKDDTDDADDETESASLPPKTNTAEGELSEETEFELYNLYISTNNNIVGPIIDSLQRYSDYVNLESEEFTLWEESDGRYDCSFLSDSIIEDLDRAYEILESKGEKDALDQAFLEMYSPLRATVEALKAIYEYTDYDTYLEDNYAKSQEHHTALLKALSEYLPTEEAFLTELTVVSDQRHREELEQMKEEGWVVTYSLNMVIDLGQQLVNELDSQGVWDDNILDMDLTKIKPLYDEFSTYVDAVLEYDQDDEALSAEGFQNSGYWATFIMAMEDSRDSISAVLAKVEAGEPLDEFDTSITSLPGMCNLTSFMEGVSDMIDNYNRLINY